MANSRGGGRCYALLDSVRSRSRLVAEAFGGLPVKPPSTTLA